MRVTVYVNFYVPKNAVRASELFSCLAVMLADQRVNRLVVLVDDDNTFSFDDDRVLVRVVAGRPQFRDYFAAIEELSGLDDVNIVLNSDCFVDPRCTTRTTEIKEDEAYCISRHDAECLVPLVDAKAIARWSRCTTQDCWVIRGKPRPGMWLEFSPGTVGCDNRLAYELQNVGYRISDPYLSVRVWHLHRSAERSYSVTDRVPEPYAFPNRGGTREKAIDLFDKARSLLRKAVAPVRRRLTAIRR